jgi:DNA-binding NtrC family response regulator
VVSISEDRMMKPVVRLVLKAAVCRANVLLVGESGVGKAFIARRMHERSSLADGSFCTVFCLPDDDGGGPVGNPGRDLVEKLEALEPETGTVYVRGVDLLGPLGQRRLLNYLDARECRIRNGPACVRNRLIFSSQRDLRLESSKGKYMSQLYLRTSVIAIEVPPLRRRGSDIIALARYFVGLCSDSERKDVAGLTDDAEFFLKRHVWEGNIHELKNAINRAVVLADQGQLLDTELLEGVLAETTA